MERGRWERHTVGEEGGRERVTERTEERRAEMRDEGKAVILLRRGEKLFKEEREPRKKKGEERSVGYASGKERS